MTVQRPRHDDGSVVDFRAVIKGIERPDLERVLRWFTHQPPDWTMRGTAEHGHGWMSKHRISPWTYDGLKYVLDNDPTYDASISRIDNVALNVYLEVYAIAKKDPRLREQLDAAYARDRTKAVADRQLAQRKWHKAVEEALRVAKDDKDTEALAELLASLEETIKKADTAHSRVRLQELYDEFDPG